MGGLGHIEDYVLTGQSILRCESNGQWSESSPKCSPAGENMV